MQGSGEIKRVSIYPVLLVNFIGALGYSIILPFLVFLVSRFGGNALIYGLLGATYPAFQLIGAPILGRWSDIYGRKKVLLLSQAGTLASWFIFGAALFLPITIIFKAEFQLFSYGTFLLSLPLIVLFFARAFDGLTGGNISVANAYLADITEEKHRTANFGKMAISSNLGYILGPALAGLLGGTVYREALPVLGAIIISLVGTLAVGFFLPESRLCVMRKNPEQANVRQVLGQEHINCFRLDDAEPLKLKDVLRLKSIPFLLLMYFLIFLGFSFFYTAFPIHAAQGLKWTVTDTGIYFSVLSLMMVVVQGPVLSRLSSKCSSAFLVIVGNVILGTNFLLLTSPNKIILYTAAALFALGNGVMWPSFLSILSRVAGEKNQGAVQGFASSFGSFASIVGLIMGGVLYGFLGAVTFWVSAAIIFGTAILSFKLLRLEKAF